MNGMSPSMTTSSRRVFGFACQTFAFYFKLILSIKFLGVNVEIATLVYLTISTNATVVAN